MAIAFTLIVILLLIAVIWILLEIKRSKHKIFAVLLILAILFLYLTGVVVFSGKNIDYKSVDGIEYASKLYITWLKSAFSNMKIITGNAANMDWKTINESDLNKTSS